MVRLEPIYGPPEATTASAAGLADFGLALGVAGTLISAVGGFFDAVSTQYQYKSQASSLDFAADMAKLNERQAERDAQATLLAGEREIGRVTAGYGQAKSRVAAGVGARGIVRGVGSTAEQLASIEIAKQQDALTINANRIRGAEALRADAVNYRNQARLGRVSARNLRRSAGSISPTLAAGQTLLGLGGQVALGYAGYSRGR